MQMLTSDWLKRMVRKSASTPEARISNLFVILQDWAEAPGMREPLLTASLDAEAHRELRAFLQALVVEAKLDEPEKLAFQLYFILLGALNEELHNAGNAALAGAGEAAASLIAAARVPRFKATRRVATFASVAITAFVAGALLVAGVPRSAAPVESTLTLQARVVAPVNARPDQLAALYQMNEKLRSGQCSYPQALMLAAEQRATFMEGVVNIDTLNTATTNLEEVSQLYQKVHCSYAPAAMLL